MYESRITDLEADLAARENAFREAMAAKDGEIKELRQQMADQLMEYHELMDIKLALDMEIGKFLYCVVCPSICQYLRRPARQGYKARIR